MSDVKLGQLIGEGEKRDAIHVAIAPVVAAEPLAPGDHIGFVQGEEGNERVQRRLSGALGIVDPFLTSRVMPGERFYMFLYPQSITALRHEWTHPIFDAFAVALAAKPNAVHMSESETWLRAHADRLDLTYNAMMGHAERWLAEDEHTVQHGFDNWRDDFGDPIEFWHHYEIVTGTVVPQERKRSFYCCTC